MNSFENKRGEVLTWNELFLTLNVRPISVYPSTKLSEILFRLRKINSEDNAFCALNDKFMDEVAEAYEVRSLKNGLDALGTAMQDFGLRLCYRKDENNLCYQVWVHKIDNTQEYLSLYKPYITRKCFFDNINTFVLSNDEQIDAPEDDIDLESFDYCIQLTWPRFGTPMPFILQGECNYLCVPYCNCNNRDSFFSMINLNTMTLNINLEHAYFYDKNSILPHIIRGKECFMSCDSKYWTTCIMKNGRWTPNYDDDGDKEEDNNPIKNLCLTSINRHGESFSQDMKLVAKQENMSVFMQNNGRLFIIYTNTTKQFLKVELAVKTTKQTPIVKHLWQDSKPYLFVGFSPALWYVFDLETLTLATYKDSSNVSGQFVCCEEKIYLCLDDGRVLRMKPFLEIGYDEVTDFSNSILHNTTKTNETKIEKNKTGFSALRRKKKNSTEETYTLDDMGTELHVLYSDVTLERKA